MRTRTLVVVATVAAMLVGNAGIALGKSHLDPEEEIPNLSFFFDPVLATLYFDVHDQTVDGDELLDCTEAPPPDDCHSVEVEEPVNHGAVVSSFVHVLNEHPDLWSGPRGHLVREIAKSDAGKTAPEDGEDPVDPEALSGESDPKGPPAHAQGKANGHRK